jgi:hypothetical protein
VNRACLIGVAIAALLAGAAPVLAAQAGAASAPALDPGNIGGVWFGRDYVFPGGVKMDESVRALTPDADGKPVPLLSPYKEIGEQRVKDANEGRPFAHTKARCLPSGMPRSMDPPNSLPIQILINPGQITILFEEFNDFRIIHMDQKTHPEDPDPSFFGHQIGHWEGDTLVVDSIGFTEETVIDSVGMPHSDAMHIVERIRRTGPDALEDVKTVFKSMPDSNLAEYFCLNDRNVPGEEGHSTVQMPGAK